MDRSNRRPPAPRSAPDSIEGEFVGRAGPRFERGLGLLLWGALLLVLRWVGQA